MYIHGERHQIYQGDAGSGELLLRRVFGAASTAGRSILLLSHLHVMCPVRQLGRDAQARVVAQVILSLPLLGSALIFLRMIHRCLNTSRRFTRTHAHTRTHTHTHTHIHTHTHTRTYTHANTHVEEVALATQHATTTSHHMQTLQLETTKVRLPHPCWRQLPRRPCW